MGPGDPGNPVDDTGYGTVAEVYQISPYEITNAQYAEFLNAAAAAAAAAADPNALYSEQMESSPSGGINPSGSSGSYSYAVKGGFADRPVNIVSFYDALRFANWLYNEQPTGPQGDATTEAGNMYEWTEEILGDRRPLRGGAFDSSPSTLRATIEADAGPSFEDVCTGFRVSSVPEPSAWAAGLGALAALTALTRHRRIGLAG